MSERLEVCFYVTDATRLPARSEVVERLFAASQEWFTVPDAVFRLDYETSEEEQANWGDSRSLVNEPLGPTQLLFVYAEPDASRFSDKETPPLVSVDEKNNRTVFGVSVPYTILVAHEMRVIEEWIVRLYELMAEYGECLLAVGSEIELDADKSPDETVEIVLGSALNAGWIGLPTSYFNNDLINGAEMVRQTNAFTVLRRHDPLAWDRDKYAAETAMNETRN